MSRSRLQPNLRLYFGPASLFDTLVILGLMAGGIGLITRAIRPSGQKS